MGGGTVYFGSNGSIFNDGVIEAFGGIGVSGGGGGVLILVGAAEFWDNARFNGSTPLSNSSNDSYLLSALALEDFLPIGGGAGGGGGGDGRLIQATAEYSNKQGVDDYNRGDLKAALADFDLAIELDPQLAKAYYIRGLVHYDLGDLVVALADFDLAIELDDDDPKLVMAYYARGLVHDQLGNEQAAVAEYTNFLELYTAEDELTAYARERIEALGEEQPNN